MGVSRGMSDLRWLFVVTSIVSLALVLAFGGVVARTNRRRFIPIAYLFVIVCLLAFSGLLVWDGMAGGGLIGSDTETVMARAIGYSFYVWLSAINLFTTSIFWAFMVDVFDVDQGKRMFAFIGIGGTLGALVGGTATTAISSMTTSVFLPAGLMLLGAAFFAVGIVMMLTLDRLALASSRSRLSNKSSAPLASNNLEGRTIGGTFWGGLRAVISSPYLLGIAVRILVMATSNTII